MKELKILGPGCAKCKKLAEQTEIAAREMGLEFTVQKVTDLVEIMGFGVMVTPALVVDGVVKVAGKVPSSEEIKAFLK